MGYRTLILIGGETLILFLLCAPLLVFAQTPPFVPIIPGLSPDSIGWEEYLKRVYILAIGVAALIAVIKLMWAGFQYIGSDIITDKKDAKTSIRSVFIGLLIILSAVTILTTINPKLTGLPSLENAPSFEGPPSRTSTPVTIGESSVEAVQDQLASCKDIRVYSDKTRCCNDNNACKPVETTSTSTSLLVGLSTEKNVYGAAEIQTIALATQIELQKIDSSYEVIDLGPSGVSYTEEQIQEFCTQAAERKGKELIEGTALNQLTVHVRIRSISQRLLCIIK